MRYNAQKRISMKQKTNMKEKLRRQELCIGTHVSLGEGLVSEMMGYLDYDYLWIDMEHSCINLAQLQNHLMGARASGINAIVRIPWNDAVLAKPVMDAGADGIICPMIHSYEEALMAVEATSYPPRGVRGYGPRRAYMFGEIDNDEYLAHADENLMRFIQLEHIGAIQDLDRILTIKEIDAFIFGPNDLSGSLGKLGHTQDADIRRIIDDAIGKIRAAGRVAGVSLGSADEETIRDWYDRGVRMISTGFDVSYIMDGARANLAAMKRACR